VGGYRRIHGELTALGITVAASTVWEILKEHGIPPAPERQSTTWADFLRSQAEALLAGDLFEVRTQTGARLYVVAVIEYSTALQALGRAHIRRLPPQTPSRQSRRVHRVLPAAPGRYLQVDQVAPPCQSLHHARGVRDGPDPD
jgi:hypothetical protein